MEFIWNLVLGIWNLKSYWWRFSIQSSYPESGCFIQPFRYNLLRMDKVTIEISPPPGRILRLLDYPELSSNHKLVSKGIAVLRHYAPGVLRYLSLQRLLGHLPDYTIEVRGGGRNETAVRETMRAWMRRKRLRRLFYVIVEALLLPFTAFVAVLPGPNVVFYGLFVLFYFHFKAFLSLSRVKVEELNISLVQD